MELERQSQDFEFYLYAWTVRSFQNQDLLGHCFTDVTTEIFLTGEKSMRAKSTCQLVIS